MEVEERLEKKGIELQLRFHERGPATELMEHHPMWLRLLEKMVARHAKVEQHEALQPSRCQWLKKQAKEQSLALQPTGHHAHVLLMVPGNPQEEQTVLERRVKTLSSTRADFKS